MPLDKIHASLRLDRWLEIHQGPTEPSDPQEMMVIYAIYHETHDQFRRDFMKALKAGQFPPADALCLVLHNFPELAPYVDLTTAELHDRMRHSDLWEKVVPPKWKGDRRQHFLVMVKSIELWLLALQRILQSAQ